MSGRPRILLDVRFFHSAKIANLSTRSKLGWIWTLCEAKQQDREGVFGSIAVLRLAAGPYRDCVTGWLDAQLLHPAATLCDRCRKAFPDLKPESVVVHDWRDYQEPSRTQRWREDNGLTSGHQAKGNIGETVGETDGETSGKQGGNAYARASALSPLRSLSKSRTDEEEAVLVWLASVDATIQPNGNGYHRELVLFIGRQGSDAVLAAMKARHAAGDRGARALLFGAMNELEPVHRPSGKAKGYQPQAEEVERAWNRR